MQRVKIVEKEREALEGPRAAAELFKAKEAEANVAKSALFQYFIRQGKVWWGICSRVTSTFRSLHRHVCISKHLDLV